MMRQEGMSKFCFCFGAFLFFFVSKPMHLLSHRYAFVRFAIYFWRHSNLSCRIWRTNLQTVELLASGISYAFFAFVLEMLKNSCTKRQAVVSLLWKYLLITFIRSSNIDRVGRNYPLPVKGARRYSRRIFFSPPVYSARLFFTLCKMRVIACCAQAISRSTAAVMEGVPQEVFMGIEEHTFSAPRRFRKHAERHSHFALSAFS